MPVHAARPRWLGAAVALVLLAFGVPLVLVVVAGWPLPGHVPHWDRVATAARQGDVPAVVVVKTLAVVVWIAWAQLVWALVWELAVNLPRTHDGHTARPAPVVHRAIGTGIARLVAVVMSIGLSVAMTPRPVLARPGPVAALVVDTGPTTSSAGAAPTPRTAAARWSVTKEDSLWDIAQHALGDGSRAGEILELNPELGSARDLRAGQTLRLPDDAVVPDAHRVPSASRPSDAVPTPVASPSVSEEFVTVRPGDNVWNLSVARLREATGHRPSPAATLDYVREVVAANPSAIVDPNLIYPGERLEFPAVGHPVVPPAPHEPRPRDTGPGHEHRSPSPPAKPRARAVAATVPVAVARSTPPLSRTPGPATTASAAPHWSPGSDLGWLTGLGGAAALASGLLLAYRRRRGRAGAIRAGHLRQRATARRNVERALVAAADVPLVRWANVELERLVRRLKPSRVTANPVALEVSEARGLELLWDAPSPGAPAPWEATSGGWSWRLLYDADEPLPKAPTTAVIPGLVTLGERDGNAVLVNLEAFGTLAFNGDAVRAEALLRSMLVELAFGDDLANSYIHLVSLADDGLAASARVQQRDEPDTLELLRSVAAEHDTLLAHGGLSGAFQLRLADSAVGRELTVVAARADALANPEHLIAAAPPHRGVALLLLGAVDGAPATVDVDDDGQLVLEPLGLTLQARLLTEKAADDIDHLMRAAVDVDEPAGLEGDEPSTSSEHAAGEDVTAGLGVTGRGVDAIEHEEEEATDDRLAPTPELLVRVLGVPTIDGHAGLGRVELNLVTFLACNGRTATESQLIDAVWNGRAVERATLWNRISKARATLGRFIPARDQGASVIRLAAGVMTDAQLLRLAFENARSLSSSQATDELVGALDLVRGVPFDAVGYDWAHEQQHYADACELIERAVIALVELALEDDDVDVARHAVSQGLRALRVNEPLYRARMRIEAHGGNLAGARAAYDELVGLLDELDGGEGAYGPSDVTTMLLDELSRGGRRSA